jgi:hypothetical protein
MTVVDTSSVALSVDAINEALFYERKLTQPQRQSAARFIAARQGQPGAYHGLFAPLPGEPCKSLKLFTGEAITSWAGSAHILGQEAYRALLLLDVPASEVQAATERAAGAMGPRLADPENASRGMYCCGKCSASVWRVISAGGYHISPGFIERGLKRLAELRDGAGRWRVFPYWYTLLALVEMDSKAAVSELRYAAPLLERCVARPPRAGVSAQRRHTLAQRALAKC